MTEETNTQEQKTNLNQKSKEVESLEIKSLKKDIFFKNMKIVFIFLIFIVAISITLYREGLFNIESSPKVAIIEYNESITTDTAKNIMNKLDSVAFEDEVKEVIFIMNSPGGSPAASEELSEYLKKFKEIKPITMYVESIAASGGYYIASAIKPLYANKNAMVGSIGVIMPHYSFEELAKKVGVKEDFIAAGKFKKPVSPLQDLNEDSKEYMTDSLLLPIYENFINAVAKNRGLPASKIREFAEGKVFIANNKEVQGVLVDEISSLVEIKGLMGEKYGNDILFYNLKSENPLEELLSSSFNINVNLPLNGFNIQ